MKRHHADRALGEARPVEGQGARRVGIVIGAFSVVLILSVAVGCAAGKAPPVLAPAAPVEASLLVGIEPVAVRALDAPGLEVEVLTARLRDAFLRTSGAAVVDEVSVRAEIAACVVAPCPDALQERFKASRYVMTASLSRVGSAFLGSAVVLAGTAELGRVSAQGAAAARVVDELGWRLGERFRGAVVQHEAPAAPPLEER